MLLRSGSQEGGVLRSLILPIFIAVIMLVLTLPVGSTLGAHPVLPPDSRGVTRDVRAMSSPEAPSQIPSVAPSVAYTLDLCTNHLYSGNALPTDCNGSYPVGVAYDSGKGEVFVTNSGWNNVSVISDASNTVVSAIPVGSYPWGVGYDSGKGEVFVANGDSNNVSVISDASNTVVATIPVGTYTNPAGVAYDGGKGEVFVTNEQSDNVSVISDVTNKVVATIPVGTHPVGVAYDSGKGEVFVTNVLSDNVSVISDATNKMVATIPVGGGPVGVGYDNGKGEVFVTNQNSNNVNVISDASNTVVATIPVGGFPQGVAYDSGKGEVFVTNYGSNNVSGISDISNTVTSTVPVGSEPVSVTYDLANGNVYISNRLQGTISIITTGPAPSTYSVTFSQSGLPAGPTWSVTLNSQTLYSTTGTIMFSESIGTYAYTVGAVSGYTASPSSGSVTVNGASQTVAITFTPSTSVTYAVTFSESGLPSGTSWSVSLNGVMKSGTGSIVFTEPNGTYSFSVGAVPGYTASPSSGSFTVSGVAVNKAIPFTALPPGPYSLTFSESGLPTGTNWSVTAGTTTHSSTGSTIAFAEANGTYSYTVGAVAGYTATPSSGSVTVNGVPQTVSITFTRSTSATYAVTFSESGLLSGTSWSVTLSGTTKSGTGSLVFTEPNGTYSFSVGAVPGYTASLSSGSLTVNGVAVSKAITFTALPPGQYSLTFSETGLPTDTNWSVTVGSTTHTSTGSTISFAEMNGTYSYTVGAVKGYAAAPSSGNVTINGAPKTVSITFLRPSTIANYAVTFTETGLPAGTSWSVTLNGSTKSSTTATITFQEANGSYSFTVGSVSGYTVGPSPGTIKVDGAAVSQPITFTSSSSQGKGNQTTGFLGLSGYDGYILIGVIVVAVATGALVLLLRKRSPPRGSGSVQDSKNIADGAASQVAVE